MKAYKNLGLAPEQILADVAAGINALRRVDPASDAKYSAHGCWKCGGDTSVHSPGTGLGIALAADKAHAFMVPHCKDHPEMPPDEMLGKCGAFEVPLTPANAKAFMGAITRDAVRAMKEAGVVAGLVRMTHAYASSYPADMALLIKLPQAKNRLPVLKPVPYPWRPDEQPGAYGSYGDALAMAAIKPGEHSTLMVAGRQGQRPLISFDMTW